jgi:hypothetical protein
MTTAQDASHATAASLLPERAKKLLAGQQVRSHLFEQPRIRVARLRNISSQHGHEARAAFGFRHLRAVHLRLLGVGGDLKVAWSSSTRRHVARLHVFPRLPSVLATHPAQTAAQGVRGTVFAGLTRPARRIRGIGAIPIAALPDPLPAGNLLGDTARTQARRRRRRGGSPNRSRSVRRRQS